MLRHWYKGGVGDGVGMGTIENTGLVLSSGTRADSFSGSRFLGAGLPLCPRGRGTSSQTAGSSRMLLRRLMMLDRAIGLTRRKKNMKLCESTSKKFILSLCHNRNKNKMKPAKNMISFCPRYERKSLSAKHARGFSPGNTICI